MKIVHTFWIDQGKDPLKDSFGWCSARYHLMSWALSCLQLHRFYDNVELITDTKGKELLIDHLKLPYKTVRIELDDVDFVNIPGLWVMKKIYSYTLHQEPFLNVDGDVYIFRPFPDDLFHGQLIAQNIEQDFDYYKELVGLIGNIFPFVPYPISKQMAEGLDIQASNAGILGGNNHGFFKEYYQVVEKFISENQEQIAGLIPSQMVNFNAVAEQYIFHCMSTHKGLAVNYLLDTVYDPSFFESFANFHHLPNKISFMHALGDYKKNGWVSDQLANRLRIDYPEYYYRIIGLFESQGSNYFKSDNSGLSEKLHTEVSSFKEKYLAKSEGERFYRTEQIIMSICEKAAISVDRSVSTIFQCKKFLIKELTDSNFVACLDDVFGFEKEKERLIQSLPLAEILWKNEADCIEGANQVFEGMNFLKSTELKLSPIFMAIESEWDWVQNHVLFTCIKGNSFENNLLLQPHYYQTLLLFDKHHGEIIEYLLGPIEAYLLSLLSKDDFLPISQVFKEMNLFFENTGEQQILVYLEEAIRFLGYSGVLVLRLSEKKT